MKRIGTTDEGGALIELSADEVSTIQAALPILSQFGCEVPQRPASALASQPKLSKVKPVILPAVATKTCTICGETKPGSDFYAVGRQCRACLRAKAKAKYQPVTPRAKVAKVRQSSAARFAPKDHKLSGRVTRDTAPAVRERDPQLDRPVLHGRVEQVGAKE